jgi:hypothetical protein
MTSTTRIQLSRRKGWRMPPDTVKVDRSTRWGNPWKVGTPGSLIYSMDGVRTEAAIGRDMTAADAELAFTLWLLGYAIGHELRPETLNRAGRRALWDHLSDRRQTIFAHLHMLRGKHLACWCPPGTPCHAEILLSLAAADPREVNQILQSKRRD